MMIKQLRAGPGKQRLAALLAPAWLEAQRQHVHTRACAPSDFCLLVLAKPSSRRASSPTTAGWRPRASCAPPPRLPAPTFRQAPMSPMAAASERATVWWHIVPETSGKTNRYGNYLRFSRLQAASKQSEIEVSWWGPGGRTRREIGERDTN